MNQEVNSATSPSQGYRYAVTLNNIGVSLLCRGAFQHARLTLLDACVIIQSLLSGGDNSQPTRPTLSSEEQQRKLRSAERRLAQIQENSIPAARSEGVRLQMVCDNDDPGVILESICAPDKEHLIQSASATIYPMRIDNATINSTSNIDELELQFNATVVIYNHALAHRCLGIWPISSSPEHLSNLERTAKQLLQAADSSLSTIYGSITSPEVLSMPQVMLLAGVLVQNLVVLAYSTGQPSEVEECTSRLSIICGTLRHMQKEAKQITTIYAGKAA